MSLASGVVQVRSVPKIDLHRHLLGSARPETLWSLARSYNVDAGNAPLEAFRALVVHRTPQPDLARYIRPWQLFRDVVRRPEDIKRIAEEAAIDAREDGVVYVEFRASLPGLPLADGIAPQTLIPPRLYLDAIRQGFQHVPGIVCRLIASVVRHAVGRGDAASLHAYADRFLDAIAGYRSDLVVGTDLTGIERGWPNALFSDVFQAVRTAGLPITIHAGETEDALEIRSAVDLLRASRIGHGTSATEDAALAQYLVDRRIVIEVCPTAGWLVGRLPSLDRHPVLESNPSIQSVICTDNPTLNATTLSDELVLAASILRKDVEAFSRAQFELAKRAAFAPPSLLAGL